MNNLIKLTEKGVKPNDPKAVNDKASKQRGAPMVSRFGVSTKSTFTCFFRGAKGETGGRGHSENVESHVRKLQASVVKDMSEIVNEPVKSKDIKAFMAADAMKKEQEAKRDNMDKMK